MQSEKHSILSKRIKVNTFQMIFLLFKKFFVLRTISCSNFHSDSLNGRILPILPDYNTALQQRYNLHHYNSFVPVSTQQHKISNEECEKSSNERKNTGPIVYNDNKALFHPNIMQKNSQTKLKTCFVRSEDWSSPFLFGSEQIFGEFDLDFMHKNYIPNSPTSNDDVHCLPVTLQTKAILRRSQPNQTREIEQGTSSFNESLQQSKTCESAITASYKKTTNLSLIKNAKFRKTPEQKSSSDHESGKSEKRKFLMKKINEIIKNRDNKKKRNDGKIRKIQYNKEQKSMLIDEKFFPKNRIGGYYQFFDSSFDFKLKKEISTPITILTFSNKKELYENWIKDKFSCIKALVDMIKLDGCDNSKKCIYVLEKNYGYLCKLLNFTDNYEGNIRTICFYNFYLILSELIHLKNTKYKFSMYKTFYIFFLRLIVPIRDLSANLKQKYSNCFLFEYEIITDYHNLSNILRLKDLETLSLKQRYKIYVEKNINSSNKQKIQQITGKIKKYLRENFSERISVEIVDLIFTKYAAFEDKIIEKVNNYIKKHNSTVFQYTHIDNLYAILSNLSLTAMNILIIGNNMNGLSFDEISNQILTISAAYIRPILQKIIFKYIANKIISNLKWIKENLRLDLNEIILIRNDKKSNFYLINRINELNEFYGHTLLFYDFVIDNCLFVQNNPDSNDFNTIYEKIEERITSFYSQPDCEYK